MSKHLIAWLVFTNKNNFVIFLQEELAFMLEILGLKEDALIQYDELDAMFDQFIENHANGSRYSYLEEPW